MGGQRPIRNVAHVSLWVKYTMVLMNVLFFILGCCIFGFGIWGLNSKDANVISDIAKEGSFSTDPLLVFIIIGTVIVIVAFFGCIGALRENTCMLKFFRWILILIILLEVVSGVLGYVYQDSALNIVESYLNQTMLGYYDDTDTQFIIDETQQILECCGINEPDDWQVNRYFTCNGRSVTECGVPFSCCQASEGIVNYQCGYQVLNLPSSEQHDIIYVTGCVQAAKDWFLSNLKFLAIVIGLLLGLEAFSLILAGRMVDDIKWVKANW